VPADPETVLHLRRLSAAILLAAVGIHLRRKLLAEMQLAALVHIRELNGKVFRAVASDQGTKR
jgi:hypothetical protein